VVTTATVIKPYREIVGDTLKLNLHPGQTRAWLSKSRFPVILAGTQSGKTEFEPDWLHREIVRRGPGDYIVGTATYPLLGLKLLPVFDNLFCSILKWGKYTDSDKTITANNGKSRIIFFSAVNPEAMESATAKAAVLDEAGQRQYKLQTWEAVQRRLSINLGRCLFGTTLYQLGWLKTEVYDRARAGDPDFDIIQFDSTMNPAFPREEFDKQKAKMPAWKFDMFYRGRYTRPVGLVYDSWNEDTSKIKRFPIPATWPVYVGHDFGGANPAAMFYAQDPATGYFYTFREYLPGPGRSTAQHVEEFKKITAGMLVLKRAGGNQTTEDEIRQGYTAHGWPIQAPKLKNVHEQIDRVYALTKLNKLFVFDDLSHFLDELMTFSYELDDKYQPTDKYDDEQDYHLLAATRYILSDFTPETVPRRDGKKPTPYF